MKELFNSLPPVTKVFTGGIIALLAILLLPLTISIIFVYNALNAIRWKKTRDFSSAGLLLLGIIGCYFWLTLFSSATGVVSQQTLSAKIDSATTLKTEEKQVAKSATPAQPTNGTYHVTKIVDGDTIDVEMNGKTQRIRLIGIDTPELVDPRKPVQCFAKEASAKAKSLLTDKDVRLELDPTQGDWDKNGRLLAYIYFTDGTSFNKLMIDEGYAFEYTYKMPYTQQKEFRKAELDAKKAGKGLWSEKACSGKR
ncbi:MAG: thermonuclease family protein, partial [bacterium]